MNKVFLDNGDLSALQAKTPDQKTKAGKTHTRSLHKIPSRTVVTKRLGFSAGLLVVFTLPYHGLSWFCHSNDLTSSTMGSPWAEEAQERIGANLAASLSKYLTRYLNRRYASKTGNNSDLDRVFGFRQQGVHQALRNTCTERSSPRTTQHLHHPIRTRAHRSRS